MGFSLTGTHVIFFVAAIIVAGAVSGIFVAITMNVSMSLSDRGDRIQEHLDTDFKIINDPENIPTSGSDYVFYLKNIGGKKLSTTNETFQLFIDGDIIATVDYNFSDDSIQPSKYTRTYVAQSTISSGYHTLRVVGPLGIEDEFTFEI
ncbi:putative archaeal flagellar protein G [Thermoplasmatales archaeon SCGC AB-540-F20]|nr:putative archaeal flagellar protein G [Thermoplasmatales archaeon SCGC AB-540-F20]